MCETPIYKCSDYVATRNVHTDLRRKANFSSNFMPEYLQVTEFCVHTSYRAYLAKKPLIIKCFANQLSAVLRFFIPDSLLVFIPSNATRTCLKATVRRGRQPLLRSGINAEFCDLF